MILLHFFIQTDDDGIPELPQGLNVYPVHEGGLGEDLPFFSPMINSLCYPLMFPYGQVPFENSTIPLVQPKEVTQDTLDFLEANDKEHNPEGDDLSIVDEDDLDGASGDEAGDEELEVNDDGDSEGNQVLRPTEDEELDEDPPTDDEPEDQPVLPSCNRPGDSVELPVC